MKLQFLATLACVVAQASSAALGHRKVTETIRAYEEKPLQDIVTWDENSLFVRGERVVIYGGEFHPFRLPVPSLWRDVFQKMKALGYNTASIYWDWALLEGEEGAYRDDGVFSVGQFLQIAKEVGIYIIARPGPYINAEVSGGGFPGWLSRNPAHLRTNETGFLEATQNYINNIAKPIVDAQITNGGAVILFQPENEYLNGFAPGFSANIYYVQAVIDQWRETGVVVPMINNYGGNFFQPGTGIGAIDLYGGDSYPQGFDCKNPFDWTSNDVQKNQYSAFRANSNSTPVMIPEFQGGSFDPWGGTGFENCAILTNHEFERVFYKNNFAAGLKIISYYMTYGGTNWGNLGYPVGYTSYDYGAAISENRLITREKYSEAKLIANFWRASPAYLTAEPGTASDTLYTTETSLTVTPVLDTESATGFYVVRRNDAEGSTSYKLMLPTSAGNLTIPQIEGSLTLAEKDSKIHVVDYPVGSENVLYSSAEIFTHQNYSSHSIAVFYGGVDEVNEIAFSQAPNTTVVSGSGVTVKEINGTTVLNWKVSTTRNIIKVGADLYVYLIDRNSAYNYWVTYLPGSDTDPSGTFSTAQPIVLNGGYLIRNTTLDSSSLHISGDLNSTSVIELIGAPSSIDSLYFNEQKLDTTSAVAPLLSGEVEYKEPTVALPDLKSLDWKVIDSLPELSSTYDDSKWISADLSTTNNTNRPNLTTPTSLYAADYGFTAGSLIYRGHFVAKGNESSLTMNHAGGEGFSASIWLNSTHVGSYAGVGKDSTAEVSYTFPSLTAGTAYVLNVLIDHTGLEQSQQQGADNMKQPRGILAYEIEGLESSEITWKVTGNLHGEQYVDKTRGPLNEGGLFAERQGYHLPNAPSDEWSAGSPLDGASKPGVLFYSSSFDLSLPLNYDIPLNFNFPPTNGGNFRCQFFINGWQFGKYVSNLGPQTKFPVPEGILNYQGTNSIAVTLWSQDDAGNKLASFDISAEAKVQSGYGSVQLVDSPAYAIREDAY